MKHCRVVKGFLTLEERDLLRAAADLVVWESGRQRTGYEKASIQLDAFQAKCLVALGVPSNTGHDSYLLRYQTGAFIPAHKDDAPFGFEHHRINVLLQAGEGGELRIGGELISLDELDAVVFRPDLLLHEVSAVGKGCRLLASVGVLVEPRV